MKQPFKIGIIGTGNMGKAMLSGFLKQGILPQLIGIADHKKEQCEYLSQKYNVFSMTNNGALTKSVDVLILAVKPQQMQALVSEIAPLVTNQLIISVAAGIESTQINAWLDHQAVAIVRAMPNTPAVIGKGMTALFANPFVSDTQKERVQTLMQALGKVVWLTDESQMHVVTALSGSGPAYFFYLMENMIHAGTLMGLSLKEAKQLVLQTAFGSVQMALDSESDLQTLRERVTSKGGTTERGIQTLQEGHFLELIVQTIQNAAQRSRELSEVK